jgi:hypothetical protein
MVMVGIGQRPDLARNSLSHASRASELNLRRVKLQPVILQK